MIPKPTAEAGHHVVVVGAGMVAHRFVQELLAAGPTPWRITMVGDEPWLPYDRVALTSYLTGSTTDDLRLDPSLYSDPRVSLELGEPAVEIDRGERQLVLASGRRVDYDTLVLATGSVAARPPVEGADLPGCFVYRTIDDLEAIRSYVRQKQADTGEPVRGTVVGGGLLGLEAAGALQDLGARAAVVHSGTHLLSAQVDRAAGEVLGRLVAQRGIDIRTGARTTRIEADTDGGVAGYTLKDGDTEATDLVIFTVGVRPRDELAAACGLNTAERGGVVIDEACSTSDPHIMAIGEVASFGSRTVGLVAPGQAMAEVAAHRLTGGDKVFQGFDESTKLKLSGIDVASFGDAMGVSPGALDVVFCDPVGGLYKKLVLSDDAKTLLGGVLVGDAGLYASLRPLVGSELGVDPAALLAPEGGDGGTELAMPDEAVVCSCAGVSAGRIRQAVHEEGCTSAEQVQGCTRAGATCGSCILAVKGIVRTELEATGQSMSNALCEHFALSRRQLFDAIRVSGLRTFSAVVARFGTGRGCDICKPTVASILSGLVGEHVLDGENAALQDTNDHLMANLQRDGSYSVVPRMPGGEVTPEGLIVIGEIARDFGLYTKLTGAQRIDMFGARMEQLPMIWRRLVDAGFESGQAYGKSLRTVKSCVGSTWCRYGVQDAVGLAVRLELRYRGLRAPHKLKLGVSGCARECAEARGKDVGIIASEHGWNMYVGGNGGFTPRHAQLLAEGLDEIQLTQAIDRFFMYYIRTADRLQRTAPWFQDLEGGIEALRDVIFGDSLGICDDLDAAMAKHVDSYEDEWAATLKDPERLRRFESFVNAPTTPDPSLAYVPERGQVRPATQEERRGPVLVAGTTLEVRK